MGQELQRVVLWNSDEDSQLVPVGDIRFHTEAEREERQKHTIKHECEESIKARTPIRYRKSRYTNDSEYWTAGEYDECITGIIYCPYCGIRLKQRGG